MGFPDPILTALTLMTHDNAVPYLDYVAAIKGNSIAATVKLANLRHNSDFSRLNTVTEQDLERIEKYKRAIAILEDTTE